ncbi:serine hydrolase domain-containing protein [Chitinophaga sp. 212800010-3]|uniref:serine hydrolase domain-containing protein n=1 Tax=unclassified Chitinophaga TaxID=2619133 RepID=UPI002DEB6BCA|nr:hypothetical protein [Chitinophaga sp. 212800010-3]
MKKTTTLLLSLCLMMQFSQAQQKAQQIDELVQRYADFNKFNGSILVAVKGKILLQKGYGYRNVAAKLPNTPQTIFQIGSITKEFTATMVLKLAEAGALALTDQVSKYYPDFPKGDSITIQNLLTHTSGIFNYTSVNDFWHQSSQPTTEQTVVDFLKSKPLGFRPGTQFSYSNSNYMLLAYIIQKVTGKSYENLMSDKILKPLHMTRSGFYFTALKDNDKATGYWTFSPDGYQEGPPTNPTQFIGGGEMYATVGDLYRWHIALQEGRILSRALQQQAYHPFKKEYGYGWELADSVAGRQVLGHAGRMLNGFEAKMVRVPEDDIFIVLLKNDADGSFLATISRSILDILDGQPYTLPEKPLELSATQLQAYAGKYGESKDRYIEIKVINGHLFAFQGENRMELIPLKNNYFRMMEHEGEQVDFTFEKDADGVVRSIIAPGRNGKLNTVKRLEE